MLISYRGLPCAAMALLLSACSNKPYVDPHVPPPPQLRQANPASLFCLQQGGSLQVRNTAQGQTLMCHLPNGQVIEEWELYRAHHTQQPGSTTAP